MEPLNLVYLGKNNVTFFNCRVGLSPLAIFMYGQASVGCVEHLLFSGEEKRSKKVVGTLATVSQTPQRFLIREKTNARFLTVGTDILGCPIVVSGKNKR